MTAPHWEKMKETNKVTGQKVDYKEHNDNAPPRYSAPGALFKRVLRFNANKNCSRCSGTGYIGNFKNISSGRCFECLPDIRWNELMGNLAATCTNDETGETLCEIRYVSPSAHSSTGYIVTNIELPPAENTPIFSTIEEAYEFAKKLYKV
ncbi:hypothetical protein [Malikia spinosa]|uniref:Uncharacterized protein n=1 Tax=Malikia spinosa TaxID=86180 RepID=A0A7C9IXJ5_9BURK|nr:hypothetical protein [Malikia spinosa]MYZ52449.1 hypothetical protein [Malikia spinosa]